MKEFPFFKLNLIGLIQISQFFDIASESEFYSVINQPVKYGHYESMPSMTLILDKEVIFFDKNINFFLIDISKFSKDKDLNFKCLRIWSG